MRIDIAISILKEMQRSEGYYFPMGVWMGGKSSVEEMRFLKNRKLIKADKRGRGYHINSKKLEEIALLLGVHDDYRTSITGL
jgi:hypothetical protein